MWTIIFAVIAIIIFFILIGTIGDFIGSTIITTIILVVLFFFFSATALVFAYNNLTDETPIATLYFEKNIDDANSLNEYIYTARFAEPRELRSDGFTIYGDQWRLDAQFLKMRSWANIFGVKPKYFLERIEGRYSDVDLQNSAKKLAHSLQDRSHPSIFGWSPFIDTQYGTSSYVDISINRDFKVYRTNSGIFIKAEKKEPTTKKECSWYNTLWCDS